MSIEQALAAQTEALNANSKALLTLAAAISGNGGVAVAASKAEAVKPVETKQEDKPDAAADKKAAAAEKKAAAAAEKKAAEEAKKSKDVTDERLTEVFGPLLAKTLDADQLAANKAFVASVNTHFGVTKLRELTSQEDRAQAVEWGMARAEDGDFEIPGADEEEDAI